MVVNTWLKASAQPGSMGPCKTQTPLQPRWWNTAAKKPSPVCPMSPGEHLPHFDSRTCSGGQRIAFATHRRRTPVVRERAGGRSGKPSAASLRRAPNTGLVRPQRSAGQRRQRSCGQDRNAGRFRGRDSTRLSLEGVESSGISIRCQVWSRWSGGNPERRFSHRCNGQGEAGLPVAHEHGWRLLPLSQNPERLLGRCAAVRPIMRLNTSPIACS